jgi:methionyl-tRNA formyltransferase
MLNGERSIGVTVQYMAERIDQGDIIVQRMVPLQEGQSLHAVLRECKLAGLEALLEAIDMIRTARVERHPNDPSKGRYFSFPKRDDALKFRQMGWRFR